MKVIKHEMLDQNVSMILDKKNSLWRRLGKDLSRNKYIYLMAVPCIVYYIIYHYWPMYGTIIAFKDFDTA